MYTAEKMVTVTAETYVWRDALGHAEFTDRDGRPCLFQYKYDTDCGNPREEFDHVWTWTATPGAGYTDKGAVALGDFMRNKRRNKDYAWTWLYLYRHSGDSIAAAPFNDLWDSGRMGVAYVPRAKIKEEFGWKKLTNKRREELKRILIGEVDEMNAVLEGNVYGFMVTELDTEKEESCWGYICADSEELRGCADDFLSDWLEAGDGRRAVIEEAGI
jgi:hypothetical protein